MEQPLIQVEKRSRRLLKGAPMMVVALFSVLIVVPMAFVLSDQFATVLQSSGVRLSPNIDDGRVIAEFEDAAADLLREIPPGKSFEDASLALDIRRFSVKKVAFRRFSGMGIEPRLNLVFHFDGVLPNPLQTEQRFSLPVIHVYIKAPGQTLQAVESDRIADVDFDGSGWDYQVIVDGFHDSARIFDTRGRLVGKGLDLFVRHHHEERVFEADKVSATMEKGQVRHTGGEEEETVDEVTRITAALPMELLGDPEQGEWKFFVVVGLADLSSPSMLYPSKEPGELEIFDCVLPATHEGVGTSPDGKSILAPLVVKNTA